MASCREQTPSHLLLADRLNAPPTLICPQSSRLSLPSGFMANTSRGFPVSPVRAACRAHHIRGTFLTVLVPHARPTLKACCLSPTLFNTPAGCLLHPQPKDAPRHGDRTHLTGSMQSLISYETVLRPGEFNLEDSAFHIFRYSCDL